MNNNSIIIKNLSSNINGCSFLRDVSFGIEKGEILGVIGPNGSGKTTLMETILGYRPKISGEILSSSSDHSCEIFYLPDGVQLFPEHKVHEVVSYFANQFKTNSEETQNFLGRFRLESHLNKKVSELSKGFQKRLGLAVAFMSGKQILFLDEPFDGLDLMQTIDVIKVMKEQIGLHHSIFVSIHQLGDAEKFCDRLLILNEGQILGLGSLSDLKIKFGLHESASLEDIFLSALQKETI
ncbi:MAG: ABC transporter ATP-binding protein [Bdellovibrionaceae bacterium]|nr:ABC transporter ATP-binding protein [Pseudobdellovibrionaceae bacterium]